MVSGAGEKRLSSRVHTGHYPGHPSSLSPEHASHTPLVEFRSGFYENEKEKYKLPYIFGMHSCVDSTPWYPWKEGRAGGGVPVPNLPMDLLCNPRQGALASLVPDVILCSQNDSSGLNDFRSSGIPQMGVSQQNPRLLLGRGFRAIVKAWDKRWTARAAGQAGWRRGREGALAPILLESQVLTACAFGKSWGLLSHFQEFWLGGPHTSHLC